MDSQLVGQTQNAFGFVRKLYFETSYLIKEVEGLLRQEKEGFVICRSSGYAVTTRTSSGLEPLNVELWFPTTFTVFFLPESMTETRGGKTVTPFTDLLKLLVLHIELFGKHLDEPRILGGFITRISNKRPRKQVKFEQVMARFAYDGLRIFATLPEVSHEDAYFSFEGHFFEEPLFSINSSEEVIAKLVNPMLKLYRR